MDIHRYGCFVEFYNRGRLVVDEYLYQDSGPPGIMIPLLRCIMGLSEDELYDLFILFYGFGYPDNRTSSDYWYTYRVYLDLGIVRVSASDGHIDYTCSLTDRIIIVPDSEPFCDAWNPSKNGDAEYINPRWLSLSQACRYASMSDKTLLRYVLSRRIYGTLRGGKWYLDKESIDRFFLEDDSVIRHSVDRLMRRLS
ncbi:MAG: helix-turn-helix domain-containing protein [Nitrospiraceae bacterium]|nr:helix-turn-helix domain-containing protein [Nitrospiraceae bacterium]